MAAPSLSPCAELVRRGDPDRFLSAMTAAPEKRERLFALYAFNLELARVASVVSEPMLGMIRLQWWRETVEMAFEGRDRAHEVAAPLGETIRVARLPREPFDRLIDARALDLEPTPFADRVALDAYLRDTGAALLELAARSLAPGAATPAVEPAGFAFAAANYLRAVPALIARGGRPLPGPDPRSTARSLARDGLAALARARRERGGVPQEARPAFRAGWMARSRLRAALAHDYDPARPVPPESDAVSRARLLWAAATGRW